MLKRTLSVSTRQHISIYISKESGPNKWHFCEPNPLSHGINSHTVYAMLQQNPSSKLHSEPHCSSQPMDQTPKLLCFCCQSYPPPPPHHHFLLTCLYRCIHAACMPGFMCVCVCVHAVLCVCMCCEVSKFVFFLDFCFML